MGVPFGGLLGGGENGMVAATFGRAMPIDGRRPGSTQFTAIVTPRWDFLPW